MAKAKKAARKSTARKSAGEAPRIKPIGDKFTKSSLARHISDETGVDGRSVKAVLASLEGAIYGSMHKKGSGVFTLPGTIKITSTPVAAKPRRQGKDPFTGEMRWFEAKPASVRVRARPLKKLKDAAK